MKMTFKQWLRTREARNFEHAINFDDVVVKAMEVAWSRAQEECYKDAINEIDKHATDKE